MGGAATLLRSHAPRSTARPRARCSPDGRDSLRLVKLRLGLTLIAVAILPIAAVSPLVRAVAEEARVNHHERLADQAQTAVASFERDVSRIQAAARQLLDDPA